MRIFGFRFRLRSRGGRDSEDGFTYVLGLIFIVGLIVWAIWLAILIVVALLPFALIIGLTILHLSVCPDCSVGILEQHHKRQDSL